MKVTEQDIRFDSVLDAAEEETGASELRENGVLLEAGWSQVNEAALYVYFSSRRSLKSMSLSPRMFSTPGFSLLVPGRCAALLPC